MKLPIEDIYQGGNSKPRNPRMQTMLRMIGFGDNAGSGFPAILSTWKNEGWIKPELKEETRLNQVTQTLKMMPVWLSVLQELREKISQTAMILNDDMPDNDKIACLAQNLAESLKESAESAEKSAESAEKSAESAEKSAESVHDEVGMQKLSKRQKQILDYMQKGKSYSTEEVAQMIGLKGPRTRQLLNELVVMDLVSCTAATKNRRYVKPS